MIQWLCKYIYTRIYIYLYTYTYEKVLFFKWVESTNLRELRPSRAIASTVCVWSAEIVRSEWSGNSTMSHDRSHGGPCCTRKRLPASPKNLKKRSDHSEWKFEGVFLFIIFYFSTFSKASICHHRKILKFGNIKGPIFLMNFGQLQAKGIVYGKPTNQGINKWKAFSGEAGSRIDEQLPLTSRIG